MRTGVGKEAREMKWNPNWTRRAGMRTIPLAVAALLALAPAAAASSHALRPTTTAVGGGWTVSPAGSAIAAALADNVTQPALPDTGSGFITSPFSANSLTAVAVSAPTLAQGENITGVTAWVYVATGSTRSASLALYSGNTLLGWVPVPSGHSAQWYAVATRTPPTPAQAANLYMVVAPSGQTGTTVRAYAAYVDLETDAPDPSGSSTPATAPSPGGNTGTGTDGASDGGSSTSPVAAALAPINALSAKPSGVVSVPVSCPAMRLFGCTGTVTIQALASPARKSANRATTARRRKVVMRATRRFKVAAGAKATVPVVLDRRTARFVRRKGRVRARVTVTTDLGGGKTAVAVRNVTLRARRTVRRPAKNTAPRGARGGSKH
jgi:hypothetical protein